MEKTFDPQSVEGKIAARWEEAGVFRAGRTDRANAPAFCIVIPPPNVTGTLHMGHALNNTLQDILCRYERLRGRDVLWQPGMDHAGIATQMVVERRLAEHKEPDRRTLGREKFLEKVWAWKEESGGAILAQLKRLGASCDWSRERFTMDEGLSRAVVKVFVQLYKEGLIYKDKRLVNWHPGLQTAISDLEVAQVETKSFLWYFKYPVVDEMGADTGTFIIVATTRPETMLGDAAVAVHPDDERYKDLQGCNVRLPLVGRIIPIIADAYSDPEKGTGAVKITPAHDFNDFEVGRRHNLPQINIFDAEAKLSLQENEDFLLGLDDSIEAGIVLDDFEGLSREEARTRIVAMMEERGLVEKIEPHVHMVPHDEKSKSVIIEPFLTDQWYVDAKTLARPALAAVRDGRTRFVPKNWEKTYFDWLENIQPWCISRQLWWGHQIPAWYGPDGHVFVEASETDAEIAALAHYGAPTSLIRDEDVLDTWFSSALWPFSTLGWPEETPELKRYYPTNVLVTGFDIIFFWVARMMMMGLHFLGEVPFRDVYIHALVRDEKGAKMSKTKGNVIDPLNLVEQYGADALRFTLASMAAPGRDIKLSTQRVEGYRNFMTKLWNAARFAEVNRCGLKPDFDPHKVVVTLNQWIVAETAQAIEAIGTAIEIYRFDDAANAAYRFVWNVFCDWYLELAKPLLQTREAGESAENFVPDAAASEETRATVAYVLDVIVRLLHPFMPFVTEELFAQSHPGELLAAADWPRLLGCANPQAQAEIGFLVALVSELRSVRSEMNVPASAQIPLVVVGASQEHIAQILHSEETLKRLARVSELAFTTEAPPQSVQIIVQQTTFALPLAGVIDFDVEKRRLAKEISKLESEAQKIAAKLDNADFLARAPEEVVEENRERREEMLAKKEKLEAALRRFG
ncbi:valine--tRNA ligase [Beijerinckia mobilis]|uniref:valine--tRNA ligase n=1 Tax=Beijerinckia mobilis TaxID=231434 RepID=UPI00055044E2|nr:valine--tRNA ligase [Beijerinckia mobilis]